MEVPFHIVLVEPEIPHNAGAAGRLAVATGARLHLVEPLGFSLEDRYVKRTGMDYWREVDLVVWESFTALREAADAGARFWMCSTKAERTHWEADFAVGDYLVFGCESRGLPEAWIREAGDTALRVPMMAGRSLNLSTAVAVVLYEGLRGLDGWGGAGLRG